MFLISYTRVLVSSIFYEFNNDDPSQRRMNFSIDCDASFAVEGELEVPSISIS